MYSDLKLRCVALHIASLSSQEDTMSTFRYGLLLVGIAAASLGSVANASDLLLELAESSPYADSPHRISAEHNIGNALAKASILDPSKTGPGAQAEKADFARAMAQLGAGYAQLGADALAANAYQTANKYANDYLFDGAESLFFSGQYEESLSTFQQALDAKPEDATGKVTAGFFFLMAGDAAHAVPLLREAAQKSSKNRDYAELYLVLAAQMQSSDPRRLLEDLPTSSELDWPNDLRAALVSGSTRHLENAFDFNKPARQDRLCEALFYEGFSREIQNKPKDAQRFYQAALNTQASGIRAYAAARLRLINLLAGTRKIQVLTPRTLS